MSQQKLLKKVVATLDASKIEYMLTGSVASSLQGEPRLTHDIDLIMAVRPDSIKLLLSAFPPPEYYLDEDAMREAIQNSGMFNVIEVNSGDKVDFWMLTTDPFDKSRFSRKYTEDVMDMRVVVSSPEDTILAKLKWAKLSGGSEKQFIDALRVYEVQSGKLDMQYLFTWVKVLEIEELFNRLQNEAEV